MEGKKYLKWYYKVGYGSEEIAGNVADAFLSASVMVYLITVIGMDTRMNPDRGHINHVQTGC